MKQKPVLKLEIDLVPILMWGKNLRAVVSRSMWEKLRKEEIKKAEGRCCICGSNQRLHCHEVWQYDDNNFKQTLINLQIVCHMCHHVHHFGKSNELAARGKLDIEEVIQHFININGVDRYVFDEHYKEASKVWKMKSSISWVLDFGKYHNMIDQDKLAELSDPFIAIKKHLAGFK